MDLRSFVKKDDDEVNKNNRDGGGDQKKVGVGVLGTGWGLGQAHGLKKAGFSINALYSRRLKRAERL